MGSSETLAEQSRSKILDAELREILEQFRKTVSDNTVQLARFEERLQATDNKVDALVATMANNVVSPFEFGGLKQRFEDHKIEVAKAEAASRLENQRLWIKVETMEEQRQSDRTWFIRLTLGGALTAIGSAIALYLKLHGGP